jgi:hypothetical protein
MPIATIRPRTAGANMTIGGVEHNMVMSYASVVSNAPRTDETVFSTEGIGGESSVGTEELTIEFRGIMKRGTAAAGPLFPLPQNVAVSVEYDDGCKIDATVNFTRAGAYRNAGATGTIDGLAYSTGTWSKTWNTAS